MLPADLGQGAHSDPTVENLLSETIDAVAARVLVSSGFTELVYRECEINALWSLADIALSASLRRTSGSAPNGRLDRSALERLRELFEQAYRLLVRERTGEASAVLSRAAALTSGLS